MKKIQALPEDFLKNCRIFLITYSKLCCIKIIHLSSNIVVSKECFIKNFDSEKESLLKLLFLKTTKNE